MTRRLLQVGTGVALGLATVLVLAPFLAPDAPPDDPHMLPGPWPAPHARLVDHRGEPAELPGDFDGVTVVFFGYTSCPDVCPVTLANLARVADRLPPDSAARFRAVLVTVDPARDTPERLAGYVARFHPSFVGLTGSERQIQDIATAWGAWAGRAAGPPESGGPETDGGDGGGAHADHGGAADSGRGEYLVDHTTRAFVVDPGGRVVATFPGSTQADVMLPTLRRLLAGL